MHPAIKTYVGADIAQASVAFCGPTAATIENTPAALRAHPGTLPADAHVVCEATGRHHHALQQACAGRNVPLSCLNPAHARAFARSLGKHEKTDTLDAALLRRFGQERQPAPTPAPEPGRHALLDLLMLRTAVVADICDYRHRDSLLDCCGRKQLRSVITALVSRQKQIELQLSQWLENAPEHWQHRVQTLCLIKGVGVLSALQLAAYLPELGACNRRQIAKLAGLAPLPWSSTGCAASSTAGHRSAESCINARWRRRVGTKHCDRTTSNSEPEACPPKKRTWQSPANCWSA